MNNIQIPLSSSMPIAQSCASGQPLILIAGFSMTKICGIYKITSPTNRIYIGQSIDIISRWNFYKRLNCKAQPLLFYSLRKYGEKNHTFEILHQCFPNELDELEKYYIQIYNTFNSKYGLNLDSGGANGKKRTPFSDEHKRKIGLSKIGIKRSDVSKRFSILNKKRIGVKNFFFGKHHSIATRKVLREKNKKKLSDIDIIKIREIYSLKKHSQKQIADNFNVSQSLISFVISNNHCLS